MLHAADDLPCQLGSLRHQPRSNMLQAEIDDGLQPLRNRCRQRVHTQDDHAIEVAQENDDRCVANPAHRLAGSQMHDPAHNLAGRFW